jgi:NAD(P)-dependent dehydrogenase (short-subunit alcohol dehydrogenase family)
LNGAPVCAISLSHLRGSASITKLLKITGPGERPYEPKEFPLSGQSSAVATQFAPDLLAGKNALVTGASSGLGAHFAKTLATAGARVGLAARRVDRLEQLVGDIRATGGQAHPVVLDVTSSQGVTTAFDNFEAAFGTATVVVNNAGIPSSSRFTEMPEEEWRGVLDVNLDGVFRVGQEATKRMKAAGSGGSIINISSVLGMMVLNRLSAYAVSKAAVIQLTKAMALEVARDGIRVNALAPGYIYTEMNDDFLGSDAGQKLLSKVPMARAGQPYELDGPLLLLASDLGSYMTGSVIAVDGGSLLALR